MLEALRIMIAVAHGTVEAHGMMTMIAAAHGMMIGIEVVHWTVLVVQTIVAVVADLAMK